MQNLNSLQVILILRIAVFSASTQAVHYVKPSSLMSCPGQPCLTLDQYNQQTETYFITGSSFVFLAGNHTVNTTVNLTSISEITLRGERNTQVNILCSIQVVVLCENVSNLHIEGLVFLSVNTTIGTVVLKIIDSNGVWIHNVGFQGSYSFNKPFTGLNITSSNTITVTSCSFEGNTADKGGAIYVTEKSSLTLNASIFIRNNATSHGGAIYASGSKLALSDNMFSGNTAGSNTFSFNFPGNGGAIYLTAGSKVTISDNAFTHNRAFRNGGAMYVSKHSTVFMYGNTKNSSIISSEGYCRTSDIITTIPKSIPYKEELNEALRATCTHFTNNTATGHGGAMYITSSTILFNGSVIMFRYNSAQDGGAMHIIFSISVTSVYYLFFISNKALFRGGGIHTESSNFHMKMGNVYILNNSAADGGGIMQLDLIFTITASVYFIENTASNGGAIHAISYYRSFSVLGEVKFVNNTASSCGGAMYIHKCVNVLLNNISAFANSNSAFCIYNSNVTFSGSNSISNNTGTEGGGIKVISGNSHLYFTGFTVLYGNKAGLGGAIYSPFGTELTFSVHGDTLFSHNTAEANGGAIYSEYTNITFDHSTKLTFKCNYAENGGAIYLKSASFLKFNRLVFLSMSYNHATKYGGGIYHKDIASVSECSFNLAEITKLSLPYCFIRFEESYPAMIKSENNSADISGSFLYGGLLDRCQLEQITTVINIVDYFLKIQKTNSEISSEPYQLCFCIKATLFNCSVPKSIEIYPGQKFNISLIALDQTATSVTTNITALSATSRLNSDQSLQTLESECSMLSYNLYSIQDTDQLVLYPDGPCRDTGLARAIVDVMFTPCPDGFMKSGENCVCEEKLNEYNASCTINDSATISRKAGSEFWVQGWYENGTYQGLIHYKTCPRDYCKIGEVTLSLENPDTQCDLSRSGLLCGECATNHSLMLGSSRCKKCSNAYLTLLLPFALMGIALTVSLIFLRLTVSTGMINSIILYANIVQVNRKLFFPANHFNILTVFIAWMNLDLGFETCFFHGLDEYLQTWLQLVFPLYIWIILGSIIFTSRYSITMSKLTGSNPVAVLATLLLMSYTKILKIIVEVYSSVHLEYPNDKTVSVWLKDANVPYLQSKHLLLTVVVTLILIFAFLPYTLLLLLGYKTYRFSGRRYNGLLRKLRPLLESYYGPYETHTRYWTGFLLLVRCALYIVFSFNSLGGERKSLLAIAIVFMGITIAPWLRVKIYKKFIVNVIEASIYLNLVILSVAALADVNTPALVYSLVGVTLATLIGIMVYHFHIRYVTRTAYWQRIETKVTSHFKNKPKESDIVDLTTGTGLSSHDPTKLVTKTHIDLREPLLDD